MDQFRIAVADADKDYVELLTGYAVKAPDANVRIRSITQPELLAAALNEYPAPHILLIRGEWGKRVERPPGCLLVQLTEDPPSAPFGDESVVAKYQPIPRLVDELKRRYAEHCRVVWKGSSPRTTVLSVYSTAGGTGKTTVAVHLARRLAMMEANVLLLSLESLPSLPLWLAEGKAQRHEFARLLYYLKTDPALIAEKWPSLRATDPTMAFDYLDPAEEAAEMAEMTDADVRQLIHSLVTLQVYDWVILDLDSAPHERTGAAIRYSDSVWWLVTDTLVCLQKTSLLIRQQRGTIAETLTANERAVRMIMNKCRRSLSADFDSFGLHLCGSLPYVPELEAGPHSSGAAAAWGTETERFADVVLGLFRRLEGGNREWERTN